MGEELSEGNVVAGKYRLGPMLGEGGMGSVMAATDTETGESVAIKFLRPEAGGDSREGNARGRFLREIRAVRGLSSRHIAKVLAAGELASGRPFIVMEHLHGKDLARILKERERLPVAEVCEYLIQACAGLGEAHAAGIVHRDLKPANLFVAGYKGDPALHQDDDARAFPVVKVLDFGVSKILEANEADLDSVITQVTDMLGSPAYMAPEQLLSARDADARSDVYSMGAILYRLLTGELPIQAKSFREHVDCIVKGDIKPPIELRSDVPQELSELVMRCLGKKPETRFQEISQLARALLPFCGEDGPSSMERIALIKRAPPDVPTGTYKLPTGDELKPVPRSASTARLVVFGMVVLVLAAAIGAYLAAHR
jgi:serine/threonine-protein kinase